MSRMATIGIQGLQADNLTLYRVVCTERLSTLSETIVVVDSRDQVIDWAKMVDAPAVVEMDGSFDPTQGRYFGGYISEVVHTGDHDAGTRYQLTLRPWFWFLTRDLNTRIIQNKTVIEIINLIVGEFGMSAHLNVKVKDTYVTRPYTVQHRESSFDFLSRLMEDEGLYYYFDYTDSGHTMVIVDDKGLHPDCRGASSIQFNALDTDGTQARKGHLWRWSERLSNAATKTSTRDYLFYNTTALNDANASSSSSPDAWGGSWTQSKEVLVYDAPSGQMIYNMAKQTDAPQAKKVKMRLDAARAHNAVYYGYGDAFAVSAGTRFTLTGYRPTSDASPQDTRPCLIIATTHTLELEGYRSGAGHTFQMEVDLEAIPAATQWRPPLHTPKPLAGGPQTAVVVGLAGEEIYTDEHGRVKVQFYWDRDGKSNEDSSVWVRVSQGWALNGFGMMTIPRMGEEVVVDFIDGDLDHPIVTGRVNNATNTPAYALPGNKTRSWWKTNSSKGGGGYNELRFEDLKGEEEIYIHGQKDLNQKVLNDQTLDVGHDLTQTIGNDQKDTIGKDFTESIGQNFSTTIGKNHDETVASNKTQSIGGSVQTTIGSSRNVSIGSSDTEMVASSKTVTVGGSYTLSIGGDYTILVGGAMSIMASSLTITVGGSLVTVGPAAVSIATTSASVAAAGKISMMAGGMTEVMGGGMVKVQGGIVMIN